MQKIKKLSLNGDKTIFFIPLGLSLFGLLMVFNASSVTALANFQNKFYFFNRQAIFFIIGILFFFFFAFYDYHKLKKMALPFFLGSLLLLILVLIPGISRSVYGGRRWLEYGFLRFQPAEFAKLGLVIYLSSLFEKHKKITTFIVVVGLVLFLIMLEPDLGTGGVITATAVCLFFLGGAKYKYLLITFLLGGISIPILIFSSPYRKKRMLEYLGLSLEKQQTSYHLKQILISLGSGGFWGRGFGQSRQKFLFLPEAATDSIFAVIAEEFGFLGASSLIIIYIVLIFRGFRVSLESKDYFGKMLAAGITLFIGFQALINFSSMVSLTPITGIPLPFISYGGSSLILSLSAMGIVYNISRNK